MSEFQPAQHTYDSIPNISGVWWCFSEVQYWGRLLCNYFWSPATTCKLLRKSPELLTIQNPEFDMCVCVCVWGLGCQVSGDLFTPQPSSVTPQPASVSVFERREALRSRANLERICKMPNSERFSRPCHTRPAQISGKYDFH